MSRWTRRMLIALPLAAGAAIAAAPFLSADRLKGPIQQGLEQALGRRVDLQGEANFRLYPRPGVSLQRVVIHELPSLGVEPIAYIDYPDSSLDVSLSPAALLTGRIRITGIRLVAPSINIAKLADGGWTFQRLLDHAIGQSRSAPFQLEGIEVSGGRLNVKFGDVKSVFYLANTDLTLEADRSTPNRFSITIEGDPARTDRHTSSFGRLTGRGMLTLGRREGEDSSLRLNLAIERTPIAEIMTALEGRSVGLGGFAASHATLEGPLSDVRIQGRLELNEAERFRWLFARSSQWGIDYAGRLDLHGQEFRIETSLPAQGESAVRLRMRALDLLSRPRWGAHVEVRAAPLASLRELAADMAVSLPSETPVEGTVTGVLGYSSTHGTRGQVEIAQAVVPVPDLGPARIESARVLLDNSRFQVPPVAVTFSERESAMIETRADAASSAREVRIETPRLELATARKVWGFLGAGQPPPLIDRCSAGAWSGQLRFVSDEQGEGTWTGDIRLLGAAIRVDGLAETLRVDSGRASIRGSALTTRFYSAAMSDLRFNLDVDADPARRRPARLRLMIPEASLAQLERLLAPSLRRETGLLARTLNRPVPVPEWLRQRHVDAQIHVGRLTAGGQVLSPVRAVLAWDGPKVDLREVSAQWAGGTLAGSVGASLQAAEPAWQGTLRCSDILWMETRLEGETEWKSGGLSQRFLTNLAAEGEFVLRNAGATPQAQWDAASGGFTLAGLRFQVNALRMTAGEETYQGQAASTPDGRFSAELTGPRPLRISGRLW